MPIVSIEELKQAVVAGKIGAISIDTSVFEQNQYGFESGVLAQLSQFDGAKTQHLIVDTVLHEVETHLNVQSELVKTQVRNALKPLGNSWGIDKETREKAMAMLFGEQSGTARTKERLDNFLGDSSAIVLVSADLVTLSNVLERYFHTKAPFGEKEAKKREFPDAVALMALEAWTQQKGAGVLAVSHDEDWRRFCEESKSVYFVNSLPQALSAFHVEADDAAQTFRTAVAQGQIDNLDGQVLESLNSQADKVEVEFEGHANWYYESELTDIEICVVDDQKFSTQLGAFDVLDYSDNVLQVQTTLQAGLRAQFSVSFDHWDGIDKEYIGMGSTTVEMTEKCDLNVILTVRFADGGVTLEDIELLPLRTSFDFGEVEPDWMNGEND